MTPNCSKLSMASDIDLGVNKVKPGKRKIKFSTKLIIIYFSATIVFLIFIGFLINKSINHYGMASVELQLIKQTNSSLDYIKQTLYSQEHLVSKISVDQSNRITRELSAGNREVRLYDKNSNLISVYQDGIKQSFYRTKIFDNNLQEALQGNYAYISDGDYIYFAAPVEVDEEVIGVFETVYPLHLLNQVLSKTTVVLIIAGIIYSVFIIILSFYLARITVSPIKKLVLAAEKYSNQEFEPIDIKGPYEIEHLASSISIMGHKIQDYINRQNQFISNVSHELRTPLTAIKGYSQFLIDEVKGEKDLEKAVFHLNNETERLTKMVNELLLLSRLDADTEKYKMEELNLSQLVEDILESLKIRVNTENILIQKDIAQDIYILGDSQKLIRVILNVIDNAIKYSPDTKSVKISVESIDNQAVVEIEDKGIGIDKNELSEIFDRFYRAKNAKAYKGSGLGLAISREIVKAHQGDIKIESRKGKGTKVSIILPISISEELLQN